MFTSSDIKLVPLDLSYLCDLCECNFKENQFVSQAFTKAFHTYLQASYCIQILKLLKGGKLWLAIRYWIIINNVYYTSSCNRMWWRGYTSRNDFSVRKVRNEYNSTFQHSEPLHPVVILYTNVVNFHLHSQMQEHNAALNSNNILNMLCHFSSIDFNNAIIIQ